MKYYLIELRDNISLFYDIDNIDFMEKHPSDIHAARK